MIFMQTGYGVKPQRGRNLSKKAYYYDKGWSFDSM